MFDKINILGQKSKLRIYTQITLGYRVPDGYDSEGAISTVRDGLRRLAAHVPWLAGELLERDGVSGVASNAEQTPRLTVKDLRNDHGFPSFEELQRRNFPAKFFNEKDFCSRMTIPGTQNEVLDGTEPVFLVQMNIVNGGIFLSFIAEHAVLDIVGQTAAMRLLSELCDPLKKVSEEELANTRLENSAIPIMTDEVPLAYRDLYIRKPVEVAPEDTTGTWKYFSFSEEKLARLKEDCTKDIGSEDFVSTDDCLCALVCQAITRARVKRVDSLRKMKFARAVDARSLFGQHPNQMGVCLNMTFNNWSLEEVSELPLGALALQLRKNLADRTYLKETAMAFGSMLSHVDETDPPLRLSMAGTIDPCVDVQISSWAKMDCYTDEFNLWLGKPVVVLRPTFIPFPGLVYFLPKRPDGGVYATVSLREDDMAHLVNDPLFLLYGSPVE